MEAVLIFPDQLFQKHPSFQKDRFVFLIEHPLYFGTDKRSPLPYLHAQKKLLHLTSMDWYQEDLEKKYTVIRIPYQEYNDKKKGLVALLKEKEVTKCFCAELNDTYLEEDLRNLDLPVTYHTSPAFYLSNEDVENYQMKKYFHQTFYKMMRQKTGILLNPKGDPIGGQWSYDENNRKKLPKDIELPAPPPPNNNAYVVQRKKDVDGFGSSDSFFYQTTRSEAKKILRSFLKKKLSNFGPYQDAIDENNTFGFHSLLSSSINIGLLTPKEVVDEALAYADEHDVSISSIEGFVRQIIGWREFMRLIYRQKGTFQRNKNFFNHTNKLSEVWYTGETGIPPLDDLIKKTSNYAYGHHIERLMIAGNLMLLAGIDPDEAYKWFMELFIDAYDWVMVPNVYGMALYADGGLIVTKPYVSSSNYIRKMSHYKKGEWCDIWDALYWTFLAKHQKIFANNHRMRMIVSQVQKKDPNDLKKKKQIAEDWIKKVTR